MPYNNLLQVPHSFDTGEDSLELRFASTSSLSSETSETPSDFSASSYPNASSTDLDSCISSSPEDSSAKLEADITTALHGDTIGSEPHKKTANVNNRAHAAYEEDLGDLGCQSVHTTPCTECALTLSDKPSRSKLFNKSSLTNMRSRILGWKRASPAFSPEPIEDPSTSFEMVGLGLGLPEGFCTPQRFILGSDPSPPMPATPRPKAIPSGPSTLPPLPVKVFASKANTTESPASVQTTTPKKKWPRPRGFGVISSRSSRSIHDPQITSNRCISIPSALKSGSTTTDFGDRARIMKSPLLALSPKVSSDFGVYATRMPASHVSFSRLVSQSQDSNLSIEMGQDVDE